MMKLRNWLPAIGAIVLILTCSWFWYASEKAIGEWSCDTDPITVHYGDTVWAIVVGNCVGNVSRAVDAHVEFYGTNIQNGQTLYLITNQDCQLSRDNFGHISEDC